MIIDKLSKLKNEYRKGCNIIAYAKSQHHSKQNSNEDILVSYDLQAGSYIREAHSKKMSGLYDLYTTEIAEIIRSYSGSKIKSILEVGFGEATTLSAVISKLDMLETSFFGFDIAWSRVRYGLKYLRLNNPNAKYQVFLGDLFHTPLMDNSIDTVYTSHSLEPNGGREKQAITELYRITNRFLILLEPSYELGGLTAKKRILQHGYVKYLRKTIEELGLEVIEHKLIKHPTNSENPTGLIVIKKSSSTKLPNQPLACPITKTPLKKTKDAYFSKESLLAYPVIDSVPLLMPQYAICATHFTDPALK